MRETFHDDPILIDLLIISGALPTQTRRAWAGQFDAAVAQLSRTGLAKSDSAQTITAVIEHVRHTLVLDRLATLGRLPTANSRWALGTVEATVEHCFGHSAATEPFAAGRDVVMDARTLQFIPLDV